MASPDHRDQPRRDWEWEDPRAVLRRHNMVPKRSHSQNFLVNRKAVERIADTCVRQQNEAVVEFGPGVGTLTSALLARNARVIGIEKDASLIPVLTEELQRFGSRFQVMREDATSIQLESLYPDSGKIVVCGNLPYAVTGAILRNLMNTTAPLSHVVFMVQREVHDRLLAAPGTKSYGALTVFTQRMFHPKSLLILKPGSFFPAPKVGSAVVLLTPVARVPGASERVFSAVVRASFGQRRKTLRNALESVWERETVEAALAASTVEGSRRGETLNLDEYEALARAIEKLEAG